ncbi:SpoIIE family protein phosphatase [Spirilliplanes yamanashiensis]|uniref:SpoIIE family protein phosphatase n=1 Tax=Spirilliplanes yamanashiensis TaxID=42233 RepID=UPI0019518D6C|nr:SpoIIE family protein phosphatase [Spirilliplanes yamanashiensis]MDP9815218.1 serine phosphatase RsbU (regulator of sigma subunit)/anti-sigma regulatory factor (Ser/Thr protein kinase)/anti-anti-sigma regulatory factor [Spirilliplanes yamanashiensis]
MSEPELVASGVEQAPFILILCEGPELRVAAANAAARAVAPERKMVGRPLSEVFDDLAGQQWVDLYGQVYRTGEPVTGQQWRAHLTGPDGTVHELYADFSINPWRHPDGTIRGVIGSGVDVTALVRARLDAEQQNADLQQRYRRTRDVVTTLQRELLPRGLPVLPGAQIAASYLLADADTAAGGDWFDAIARPDGTVALVVGDVVGHGVTASGVMGQLRAVLHDRLDDGAGIAEALAAVDRIARRQSAARAATVCVAVLDPADGTLTYCTAGHPAPLVLPTGGGSRHLPVTGGAPLGTGSAFDVRTDRLGPGDVLLLYSDGIVERPGRSAADGTAELARTAEHAAGGRALHEPGAAPADRVCTQTVELLVRATGHSDDITLLAAQLVEAVPGLDLRLPVELSSLSAARRELGDWLTAAGAGDDDTFVLQHALGELVTNAIEHAGPQDDPVLLRAAVGPDGCLHAEVVDRGRWRPPVHHPDRGRGLAMTSQLVDTLHVERTATGTTATVGHRLSRPPRLLTGERAAAAPATSADALTVDEDAGGVRVSGPLDAATAPVLQRDLLRRSRGGTVAAAVDLSGVTHLASAGVAALHAVADRHRQQRTTLRLHAADGTPAAHVLGLVALPYSPPPGA